MPKGLYERVKELPSPHPKGLPFSICLLEIRRYLKNKFIANEDRSTLECDVCGGAIMPGQIVVAFNYFLVHYPDCYNKKVIDVPDSVFDVEDEYFIEHGYWKEGD
jgi:hypothetical protein